MTNNDVQVNENQIRNSIKRKIHVYIGYKELKKTGGYFIKDSYAVISSFYNVMRNIRFNEIKRNYYFGILIAIVRMYETRYNENIFNDNEMNQSKYGMYIIETRLMKSASEYNGSYIMGIILNFLLNYITLAFAIATFVIIIAVLCVKRKSLPKNTNQVLILLLILLIIYFAFIIWITIAAGGNQPASPPMPITE